MSYGIIYKITNLISGKVYVGQTTKTIDYRFRQHCNNPKEKSAISGAIKKRGRENFTIEQIDTANSLDELNEKEIFWIKELNSMYPNGYNLTTGGEHYKLTQLILDKMIESRYHKKGISLTSEYKHVAYNEQNRRYEVRVNGEYLGSHKNEEFAAKIADKFIIENKLEKILNFPDFDYSTFKYEKWKETSKYYGVSCNNNRRKSSYEAKIGKVSIFKNQDEIAVAKAVDFYIRFYKLDKPLNFPELSMNDLIAHITSVKHFKARRLKELINEFQTQR